MDRVLASRSPTCTGVAAIRVVVEEAVSSLAQAKAMHDDLEALYNPHVDFDRVYATADAISVELLGE